MKEAIPARGTLGHYNLPKLLTEIHKQQKTGIITFARDKIRKSIYLKDGMITFASSNLEEDRLGNLLVKDGKITQEQLEESSSMLKKSAKRHGTILVELGYIKPKNLFREVKNQTKEIILSLFLWEDGRFLFKEIETPKEIISLNINMVTLIQEGLNTNEKKKNEDETLFFKKVEKNFANIRMLSYYDILEIDMKASSSEIKKTYLKMAQHYHPDKHTGLKDPLIKNKLSVFFTFINDAYKTLKNETERKKYDDKLLRKITIHEIDSKLINIDEQFNRGMAEFKQGNFWGASDFFRWTTRKDPNQAKYWAYLSLALSNMPGRNKEAEEAITMAIKLEPHNANYYIHLGTIYLRSGLKKRAINEFKAALDWDPENKKAQKQLDKLEKEK